jgi:hypothetical protein
LTHPHTISIIALLCHEHYHEELNFISLDVYYYVHCIYFINNCLLHYILYTFILISFINYMQNYRLYILDTCMCILHQPPHVLCRIESLSRLRLLCSSEWCTVGCQSTSWAAAQRLWTSVHRWSSFPHWCHHGLQLPVPCVTKSHLYCFSRTKVIIKKQHIYIYVYIKMSVYMYMYPKWTSSNRNRFEQNLA